MRHSAYLSVSSPKLSSFLPEPQYPSDIGALALAHDPECLRLMGKATIRAGGPYGELYFARTSEGELAGFVLWMPPGMDLFNTYAVPLIC